MPAPTSLSDTLRQQDELNERLTHRTGELIAEHRDAAVEKAAEYGSSVDRAAIVVLSARVAALEAMNEELLRRLDEQMPYVNLQGWLTDLAESLRKAWKATWEVK